MTRDLLHGLFYLFIFFNETTHIALRFRLRFRFVDVTEIAVKAALFPDVNGLM